VADLIVVRGPVFSQTGLGANFEQACPRVMDAIRDNMRDEYVACFKVASVDFAATLCKLAEQIANQLGTRWRLQPESSHPLRSKLYDAEIVERHTNLTDSDVKVGHTRLVVRRHEKGKSVIETLPQMPDSEIAKLRPYQTQESKKLYDSSVTALLGHIEHFSKVGDLIKAGGDTTIANAVEKLKEALVTGGSSQAEIVNEMRDSRSFRATMASHLNVMVAGLKEHVTTTYIGKKRRLITRADQNDDTDN
jgi:hypothetical protein